MERRAFLAGTGAVLAAAPLTAGAQQSSDKVYRVTVILPNPLLSGHPSYAFTRTVYMGPFYHGDYALFTTFTIGVLVVAWAVTGRWVVGSGAVCGEHRRNEPTGGVT